MKVAIIGASGQLGHKTVSALLAGGVKPETVVATSRDPEKLKPFTDCGVSSRRADYDDPASLEAALAGVERLLLVPSLEMPVDRVRQYENAIAAARSVGVKHVIHYGLVPTTIESPFVITPFLLYAESLIRNCGLQWTILRNSLYADPIAAWVPSILEMGTIPYPTGDGRCAYISRDDVARAGAAVLAGEGHAGKVYNLSGPTALTTADLCGIVARVTGQPVKDVQATDEDYMEACRKEGEPEYFTQLLLTLYHAIKAGHLDLVSDDVEALTGTPAQGFEEYLRSRIL